VSRGKRVVSASKAALESLTRTLSAELVERDIESTGLPMFLEERGNEL
jgi:NAD(P)-dependent dehydrogenase (short-subunit alcohol dehydrogenase family)